jgi:hypothetical protein
MQSRQGQLIDTARNVQAFLDENAAVIGPNISGVRANLDDAVSQLNTMAVTQSGGKIKSKGATARQKSVRASLRANFMKPVADIAKLKLGSVPEFGAFVLPPIQLGATQLVAAAYAMADAAQLYQATFTAVGMPADFIPNLRAAADAVTASMNARQAHVGTSTSATQGIQDQEKRVRALFKLINALVVPKLGDDVVLLHKWRATKAITHKGVVPVPPPAPSAPVAPVVAGTAPVSQADAPPAALPPASAQALPPSTAGGNSAA